jgi:hypothetical protein
MGALALRFESQEVSGDSVDQLRWVTSRNLSFSPRATMREASS